MYTKKSQGLLVVITLMSILILLISGCSSSSKKSSTTNSTMSLTASPTTIKTGNTSVVEVSITNGGVGVADQVVVFSVDPTNAGFFTPGTDTTDANGVAATVFTAVTSGSANFTATASSASLSRTIGVLIQQDQQTGSGNVNVTVAPSVLIANGTDSSLVSVVVRDALGQLAPESTAVKLAAGERFVDKDGNGYWSNGADSLVYDANANSNWDAIGLIPSLVYTNSSGVASTYYYSGKDAFTVYIKATVNDQGITGYGEAQLQLSPNASINSIYLASDSMNLSVKQTGGIETGILRAICYDVNGNTVPEGLTVNFLITNGPNGGEHLGNVGYGPYPAVTNSQGIATASIHSGTKSGTIRIRATSDTVLSNATQVMVSAGPPAHIVIGADTCNVPFWYTVNGRNGVVAVVSDVYLNPVNDSTVVYFSCDEGSMISHMKRTEKHEGVAYSEWISGNNVDSADGIVVIMAETSGGLVADTGFFFNSGPCDTIFATGIPAGINADGQTKFRAAVYGLDINRNLLINGTIVKSSANYLKTENGTFSDGCGTSMTFLEFTSATLTVDNSMTGGNDNGIGAVDVITVWSGYASRSYTINLLTGFTSRTNSGINGASSIDTGKTVDLSVFIKDRWGNPLGDHTLNMSATGGTVTGASQKTDAYGEAFGFKYHAPTTAGTQIISVADADPRGGGVILTLQITVNAPE